jgi:D-arginine dehydrogenase
LIYDFLIVGGGIAGVSAAYELASSGNVLLLEAEDAAGYHATGRSAALFTRNYGGPEVRRVNASSASFFRSPPPGFTQTPLLSKRGCLTVSPHVHSKDIDALLALSEPGEEIMDIDVEDACAMVPFLRPDRVKRAVMEANVADIDVATLHASYMKGAKARGAQIMLKQPVKAMSWSGTTWTVQTTRDTFQTLHLVNAAGAWADQIGALAQTRPIGLVPKRRTAVIIKTPDSINCAALPAVDFAGSEAYLKPEGGKLMVSPGDAEPMEPHDAWADEMDIAVLADWVERETTLKVEKIEHSWAGLRSFVPDEAPVVGFDRAVPNFFWLAGQGGFGIMMAPALAVLTAELMTCGKPSTTSAGFAGALSPERLQSY